MGLRNALLDNFERALTCATDLERQELLNIVIVGGGATGVEIAGAPSEMKKLCVAQGLSTCPLRSCTFTLLKPVRACFLP